MRPLFLGIGELELATSIRNSHYPGLDPYYTVLIDRPHKIVREQFPPKWDDLGDHLRHALPMHMPEITCREDYEDLV